MFIFARCFRIVAILAALVLVMATGNAGGAQDQVNPNFVVWSYSIETIQDNVNRFQEANPGVTITLSDFSWFDYHDVMATRFTSGTPTELAYSSDHWLQEWVAAGWIVPLNDYCPALVESATEFAPYAVEGMTVGDNLYGVPYYADLVTFFYNAEPQSMSVFVICV